MMNIKGWGKWKTRTLIRNGSLKITLHLVSNQRNSFFVFNDDDDAEDAAITCKVWEYKNQRRKYILKRKHHLHMID